MQMVPLYIGDPVITNALMIMSLIVGSSGFQLIGYGDFTGTPPPYTTEMSMLIALLRISKVKQT